MKPTYKLGMFALAACCALPRAAFAQDAVVEGPGIALGEGAVFHPSVTLESGYVSNVFYTDEDPIGSAVIRLIGAFSLASQTHELASEVTPGVENEEQPVEEPPPPAMVDFRLGGQAVLNAYASDNDAVRDQTDVGVAFDGSVIFNPHGDVAGQIDDTFLRDTRPHNFESTGNLNRDYNHALASLTFQPQGRTISVGARYENTIDRFESNESDFANRLQHTFGLRGDWRLFPYTKLFIDASLGYFTLLESDSAYKPDSTPLRIQAGAGTALTEVTTIRAYIGYANGFYDSGTNFQNAIGGAEFGYRYTEYGRLTLTADYNFHDSLQANFFRDYSLLAKLDQQFGLVVLGIDAGLRLRGYRGIPTGTLMGPDERDDVIFNTSLQVAYLLRDWFAITARGTAIVDATDYDYMAGARTVSPAYNRLEAFLGLTAAF